MAIKASAQITISKVIDIYACYRYYKLQSSTLTKPSKPTTNPPSGWSDTEPAYVSGSTNTLYFVDCNVYSDKSFSFSEVSKSSSYEAAKDAWNKANNAQNTVDNLEIGGRNLLRNSGKMLIGTSNYVTGTWRQAGTSTMTRSHVEITDPPKSCQGVTGAYQAVGAHPSSKADAECIGIDNFPYFDSSVGSDIIMSGWARVVGGGDNCYFGFSGYQLNLLNGTVLNNYWCTKLDSTGEWTRVVIHGKTKAKVGAVYCGFITGDKSVTVQACGLKFEKGNLATDWTPAPEDSILKVDVEYYLSTSATSLSGGSWSTTAPTWVNGRYMWSRTVTVDGVGNKTYSPNQNGVCIAGAKGDRGDKGATGETGPQGPQGGTGPTGKGVSSIVEQYYKSTSATALSGGSWSNTYPGWENGKYIWTRSIITYTDKNTTTTAPVCVTGTKGNTGAKGDKGETGPQGPQGVQGVKGADGKTYYTWIKYADSPTSGMSDNPSGKKYIGVAYNKTTATESTTYSDYSWSLIKGDKGDKGDKGETGGTGPTGPTGNGIKSIAYYYARTTSQTAPSAASITATSMPTLDATNKYLWQKEVITYTNNTSQTSVLLLAVYGNTGAKGDKGDTGPAGKGISSTEVTYQASTSGTTIPKGTWAKSIPSVAAGSYLWTRTIITYTDKTSTTSYAVGKMGNTGATGKGIKATSITYQAHSNGTTAPTGTWTDLVPTTSAEKPYLWSRTILTYTDNTTSTTYSVGSTPDGVLDEIRKVLRYDNTKIVLGQDGEPTSLELTNEGLTVKSDSEDIISVTGENREVTSGYNPSGATFTRRYGKIINADGTIISCGNTVAENDYEIAEMVQYTGTDPLISGHEAGIDITAKIAGVDSGTNKTETSKARISMHTIQNSRASIVSEIDSYADWIHFYGKQINFYPTVSFGIDGESIGFKGKGIGIYPTEELELGIPAITGDCNKLTKSCTWYLGNNSTNRPLNQNGWLISRPYSTDYCHQTYITCTGGIYRRMMQAGKWGIWQGGYANVKKLWSGTLSKGGSVTVANLSLFDTFILGTSSGTAMLIGTRYYDPNNNRGTTVLFTAGHDDGTTSYLYKATTSMSGTTFRLTSCSVHTLDPTGCGGHAATVKSLYGVM